MSVLVNAETGLAEEQPEKALQTGAFEVPLVAPDGTEGSAPLHSVSELINQGYRQPNKVELDELVRHGKFNTTEQQIKTAAEGVAEGLVGPLAPLIETKLLGVDPEDIRNRAKYNPWIKGLTEVGALLAPAGQGALLGKAGKAATEALGITGKVGELATRGMIEGALFQTGSEISNIIKEDPEQSLGSAAAHIGLSSVLGAGGGAALGAIGKGFDSVMESKAGNWVRDFTERIKTHVDSPNITHNVTEQLTEFYNSTLAHSEALMGRTKLKGQDIGKLMPEVADEALVGHANKILESGQEILGKDLGKASERIKGKLGEQLEAYAASLKEAKAPIDYFNAADELKHNLQQMSKFGKSVDPLSEGADLVNATKKLANEVRTSLEDTKIWGASGQRQKEINKAFSELQDPLKKFKQMFGTKDIHGDYIIEPNKIATYVDQVSKDKAVNKQNFLKEFIDSAEKFRDQVSKTHANLGVQEPIEHVATDAIKGTLGKMTPGAKAADAFMKKQIGEMVGGGIGGAIGGVLGHPVLGAIAGTKALGPVFDSIIPGILKSVLSMPASGAGFSSAMKYGADIVKGERKLQDAALSIFNKGVSVKFNNSNEDREKLQKRLDELSENPEKFMDVGGHVGHYMPEHGTSIAMSAVRIANYLNSIKPVQPQVNPLDPKKPISKEAQTAYNRALDIANDPTVVLKHVADGTFTNTDMQHLANMWPGFIPGMRAKVGKELIDAKAANKIIPFDRQMSLSVFMGQPLSWGTSQPAIQMSQMAQMPRQNQQNNQQSQGTVPAASKMTGMMKLPNSYATPGQARQMSRTRVH